MSKKLGKKSFIPFISILPGFIRRHVWMLFMFLRSPYSKSKVFFKVAEKDSEISQALKLIAKSYNKYLPKGGKPVDQYCNKYLFMPSTIMVVGKVGSEVVCCLSIIRKTPIGFPSEQAWNLDHLKRNYKNIVEISTLVVKDEFKANYKEVLISLFSFSYQLIKKKLRADCIVISCMHNIAKFYIDLFGFKYSANDFLKKYPFKNVESRQLYLPLANSEIHLKNISRIYPKNKSLFHIMTNSSQDNFVDFKYSPWKTFNNFFLTNYLIQNRFVFDDYTKYEDIAKLHAYGEYKTILVKSKPMDYGHERLKTRFQVAVRCYLVLAGRNQRVLITDVSEEGVRIKGAKAKDDFQLLFKSSKKQDIKVNFEFRWFDPSNNEFGGKVKEDSLPIWEKIIKANFK